MVVLKTYGVVQSGFLLPVLLMDIFVYGLFSSKNGTYGQVITFWYNSPERELIALSFKDFIVEYTKNIQNGVYVYQQEDGCGSIVRKDGEPMF